MILAQAVAGGTGITYDSSGDTISITNTGVSAGTYGSSTQVPQISVNAQGQIDSAKNITIAGVTGVDFDSSNGTITIQTTGGNFTDVITLDPFTTAESIRKYKSILHRWSCKRCHICNRCGWRWFCILQCKYRCNHIYGRKCIRSKTALQCK